MIEIIFTRTIICAVTLLVFHGLAYLFDFVLSFASVAGLILFQIGAAYGQIIERDERYKR